MILWIPTSLLSVLLCVELLAQMPARAVNPLASARLVTAVYRAPADARHAGSCAVVIAAPAPSDTLNRRTDSTATPRAPADTAPPAPRDLAAARRKLPLYAAAVEATLDPTLRQALDRIRSSERRLLALRGYVRREHRLATHWSWTGKEVRAYRQTEEYKQLRRHIAEVRRRFAAMNPGYHLVVSTGVRTLEAQIASWNRVASIRISGLEMVDTSLAILADTTFPDRPDSAGTARFRAFFHGYELVSTPTVAVPGFSEHGQLRAFDFKVHRGRRLVAGTSTATVAAAWDSSGWSCRLAQAICDVSDRFLGPLVDPYEPWHYSYSPALAP